MSARCGEAGAYAMRAVRARDGARAARAAQRLLGGAVSRRRRLLHADC